MPGWLERPAAWIDDVLGYADELTTPAVRLGVTGLSRAGKTVFITALVHSLVAGGRLPFFRAVADGRILSAWLEPQPDETVPRFEYEQHLASLTAIPPEWPDGTRQISQLRVTLTYEPAGLWRYLNSTRRLHIDIVDYPGEWLLDLALLNKDFAQWSQEMLAYARSGACAPHAAPWLAFLKQSSLATDDPEQLAIRGARLFTDYVQACRTAGVGTTMMAPGRFLMPGDLAGSPAITFFPLPSPDAEKSSEGSGKSATDPNARLRALLTRRFEAYKSQIVKPFFRDHFARLDRQIVLVDLLSALNDGSDAIAELKSSLEQVLETFRPGQNTWLSTLLGRRIERVLFAATKADHLNHVSHDRLEAILRELFARSSARAELAGADVQVMALASVRATREAEADLGSERLPCIIGVPCPGERIGTEVFDGKREAAIFPGDLPEDPSDLLDDSGAAATASDVAFVKFRPPVRKATQIGDTPTFPHIRLDRALEFLIGDRLS